MTSLQRIHTAELGGRRPRSPRKVEGREPIDVEALLGRAYREQLVDRVTPEAILAMPGAPGIGGSSTAAVVSHCALGTEIDKSTAGANFLGRANMMAAVSDDFVALHDAVLALPRFYVDATGGADFVVWDDDTLARAPEFGFEITSRAGGLRISMAGEIAMRPRLARGMRNGQPFEPLRAEPVSIARSRPLYPVEGTTLAILNGRAGTRPDVSPLVVTDWRQVRRNNRLLRHDPVYETSPYDIALQRGAYAAWHACLAILAAELSAQLERFEITGPGANAEPWAGVGVVYDVPEPARRPRRRRASA